MTPRGSRRTVDAFAHIRPRIDVRFALALTRTHAEAGLRSDQSCNWDQAPPGTPPR
jgi:hypothetical protein